MEFFLPWTELGGKIVVGAAELESVTLNDDGDVRVIWRAEKVWLMRNQSEMSYQVDMKPSGAHNDMTSEVLGNRDEAGER